MLTFICLRDGFLVYFFEWIVTEREKAGRERQRFFHLLFDYPNSYNSPECTTPKSGNQNSTLVTLVTGAQVFGPSSTVCQSHY